MGLRYTFTSRVLLKACLGVALFLVIISPDRIYAQDRDIILDLMLAPQLTKAQVISLSNLGTEASDGGPVVFNLVIRNNEEKQERNLYLNIQFRSDRHGVLADVHQVQGGGFSMEPGQVVVGNNQQLRNNRLQGVEEFLSFYGGLTEEGEAFINSLHGSTRLPAGLYTVVISLYQGSNGEHGGRLITTVEETFGGNISSDTSIDLYLLQPGGELGSNSTISSVLPVFRWDGPAGQEYRLLVVEDNGQSPESLLQAALSSEPIWDNGNVGSGSFLEFEMVDALVDNTTFSMPPSGVQNLEPGKRYYWQVMANRQAVNSSESIPSEIWEFTVSDESTRFSELDEEANRALIALLGEEQYERLQKDGFQFISITIDGETLEGASALKKLQEVRERMDDGEISVVVN